MSEKKAYTIYLHAITPVHAGTGQVSASVIDLPIAREKATNWPMLPGSSLKGVFRSRSPEKERLYGTPGQQAEVQLGDARVLFFPVRSWRGVFAYATCPLALRRMARDFAALGAPLAFPTAAIPADPGDAGASIAKSSVLEDRGVVWLDDLKLSAERCLPEDLVTGVAHAVFPDDAQSQGSFCARCILLSNSVFDFLCETATEVTARVSLNEETKTVKRGGLWYEEAVPAETVFVLPALGPALPAVSGSVVQIGGNESVGRGLCRVTVASS
jgi:CRISPR-associated protein Cmr4